MIYCCTGRRADAGFYSRDGSQGIVVSLKYFGVSVFCFHMSLALYSWFGRVGVSSLLLNSAFLLSSRGFVYYHANK